MPNFDRRQKKMSWGELLALGLLGGAVLLLMRSGGVDDPSPIMPGTPMPTLAVSGWLNTDAPLSRESLADKVVLVDCWFTTCPPCRASMPKLAALYEKYQPLGVEFVGLTFETEAERPNIEQFVRSIPGFNWPVGYGARPTLEVLGVHLFPTLIVFGPHGTAVWSGIRTEDLPDVLDQALANAKAASS